MNLDRVSYYLGVASAVSAGSECRVQVGAVLVKDDRIAATGFNGYPPKDPRKCRDCPRTLALEPAKHGTGSYEGCMLHAEQNLIIRASYADLVGGTVYCTHDACHECTRLLSGSGLKMFVSYHSDLRFF